MLEKVSKLEPHLFLATRDLPGMRGPWGLSLRFPQLWLELFPVAVRSRKKQQAFASVLQTGQRIFPALNMEPFPQVASGPRFIKISPNQRD